MTLDQRLAAIEQMGIDAAFVLRFDPDLAKVTAEDFVERFLVQTMRAKSVLVGGNFRFGTPPGWRRCIARTVRRAL